MLCFKTHGILQFIPSALLGDFTFYFLFQQPCQLNSPLVSTVDTGVLLGVSDSMHTADVAGKTFNGEMRQYKRVPQGRLLTIQNK